VVDFRDVEPYLLGKLLIWAVSLPNMSNFLLSEAPNLNSLEFRLAWFVLTNYSSSNRSKLPKCPEGRLNRGGGRLIGFQTSSAQSPLSKDILGK